MRDGVSSSEIEPTASGRSPAGAGQVPIQAVERASAILGFFTPARPALYLMEITERLGVSKATAHRYCVSLRLANLLRYDPATGVYTLGPRVITLAAAARAGLPILEVAGPHMEALVAELNETVVLSIWDGEAPVMIRVADNTERIVRISVQTGSRLPLFESAQGLLFCAHLPESERPLLPGGARGALLAAEIEEIKRTGIAFRADVVPGTGAIAAPGMQGDRIAATMAVVSTASLISPEPDSPVAEALRRTVKTLSVDLGYAWDAVESLGIEAPSPQRGPQPAKRGRRPNAR
jgi:DNA-binding IclR family transcriptional regulator